MPAIGNLSLAGRMCVHHPQRVGHATCMACRNVVCQDCATTWDGINYCRPCLAKRQAASVAHGPWRGRLALALQVGACAVGLLATARMAAWSLAMLRSWGS